ncbi:hypothetical protein M758_2G109800 [Ceratodon purpureus]|nr:hypothetical protein M758_2G109800 [Ceratodon purpureus]
MIEQAPHQDQDQDRATAGGRGPPGRVHSLCSLHRLNHCNSLPTHFGHSHLRLSGRLLDLEPLDLAPDCVHWRRGLDTVEWRALAGELLASRGALEEGVVRLRVCLPRVHEGGLFLSWEAGVNAGGRGVVLAIGRG